MVAAGTCLVLAYGARLALSGQISAGVLIVFLLYLGKMYKPMRDLSKSTDTVSKAIVGYERIEEVLEIEARVRDLPGARKAPRFKGKIEFDHQFAYDDKIPVLKDMSFEIETGGSRRLSGRRTLARPVISLIPRLYDPQSGKSKLTVWIFVATN
jgi:subfamily B ATP-binding cassette protein MsbA